MTHPIKYVVLLWTVLCMIVPSLGQATNFEKHIPNRMISAGSGQGTGENVDMHVLIGQPVPGVVGNGDLYQLRTNSEDMLARRLNYTLIANAGLDQLVIEGESVMLDATFSYDPANAIAKYQWTQLSGPTVALDNDNSITPQFTAPEVDKTGAYVVFQLTVFNTNNHSAQDTVSVFVQNQVKHFSIKVTASAGGSITPGENLYVDEGDSVQFSFLASTGYYLSDVIVDHISLGQRDTYDFINIQEDHQIHAEFTARPKINVTIITDGSGNVTPEGPLSVNAGDDVELTFLPDINHHVANVIVNGQSKGPVTHLLLKNLNEHIQVTVNFMPGDFHIQASCGENGQITPVGWISTYFNTNKSFEIVPDDGYVIDKLQIDGAFIDPVSHYTFWNISGNHRIHATFRPKMVIMATSGENGRIEPSGMILVELGAYQSFEIIPDEGYRVEDVLVDGISKGATTRYNFWEIQGSHTISVTFVRDLFIIAATSGPYGSVIPEGKIAVNPGDFQFFEFNPDHGFRVKSVVVDGDDQGPMNQYYFEKMDQNHTLDVQFESARVIVQAVAGNHGSISPSGAVVVAEGDSQAFDIIPDPGYTIQNVRVDNQDLGQLDQYLFENLTESHDIAAFFEPMPIITATAMNNGAISPSGQIFVPRGEDQSIVIQADTGYTIDEVIVDGIPQPLKTIYVFWNVTESHELIVTFRQFQISATSGEHGSITPSGLIKLNKGHDQTYDIYPDAGYEIDDVLVDNVSQGPVSRYTFWDIRDDHQIQATFKERPRHIIQATADIGGQIIPSGEISIIQGDYPEFVITPNPGFAISDVLIDEESQGPVSNYIFSHLEADASIHAKFKTLPSYTFTASASEGGQINPNGQISVFAGEIISFTFLPEPNYQLSSVIVDYVNYGPIPNFPMLADADHAITAHFVGYETRAISGQIFDSEQRETPLSGFQVQVWQQNDLVGSAISDNNGRYTVNGIPSASDIIVSAWPPPENTSYRGIYYTDAQSMNDANLLVLLADDLMGVDLYMPRVPDDGIMGQVRNLDGTIENIAVHATSKDGSHSISTLTDADGRYKIQGLFVANKYQIFAYDEIHGQNFFFALPGNQTPGTDTPTESTISANLATWIHPTTPLLQNIDIIFDPDSGESISGHIYYNNQPMAGIQVNAWSEGMHMGINAISDDNGAYILKGLAPVLSVNAATHGYRIEIISDDYVNLVFSESVETGRTDIDFVLIDQSTIFGKVVDAANNALTNVFIQAISQSNPWQKIATTTTNHEGNYTLTVTPAPDYVISAAKENYGVMYYNQVNRSEQASMVDTRTLTTQVDFQLDSGASIHGQIFVDTKDIPAPEGVWVTIRSESTDFISQCQTDSQGFYRMTGLDKNVSDYTIQCEREKDMPAYYRDNGDDDQFNDTVYNAKYAEGVVPSEMNRNLILQAGYQIRGRVLFENTPVYGMTVEARSEITGGWGQAVSQDLDGYHYEINGLAPGIYTIKIFGKDYQTTSKAVTLVRQTTYLDFVLEPPDRQITGVIYDLDRGDTVLMKAVSLSENIEAEQKLTGIDTALTFALTGLKSANDYIVYVTGENYPDVYYPDQPDLASARNIDLSEGNAENIVFHMTRQANRQISGFVYFHDAFEPDDVVRIIAHSPSMHHEKTLSLLAGMGDTEYTIDALLEANDYNVKVVCDNCINHYFPDAFRMENAKQISTMTNNAFGVLFNLSPGTTIEGKISGVPLDKTHIMAISENLNAQAETHPMTDGYFLLKGLADADDYILSAQIQDLGVFYYHPEKNVRVPEDSIPLSVLNGNLAGIAFTINDLHTISGSVKSEKGYALANAFISCHSKSLDAGASTYANDMGQYTLTGVLHASDYVVTASADNVDDDFHDSFSQENITAGDTQIHFILQALDAYDIDGQILDAMDLPMDNVRVEIQSENVPEQYDQARTNKEGLFTLKGLPGNDNYWLWIWPEPDMPLAYYRKKISIPTSEFFTISLNTASHFSGSILDDVTGNPIQDAEITVFSNATGFFQETRSASNGSYSITNAPLITDYRITVIHTDYLDQELQNQAPQNQLDILMPASGCISGHLKSGQTGLPISDASVSVFSVAYDSVQDYIGTSTSNSNGKYEICNLKLRNANNDILDDYQVSVLADGYPLQVKGGLSVHSQVDFLMESHPQYELSGTIDNTFGLDIIIQIFNHNSIFIQSTGVEDNQFHVSGLNPESLYLLNVKAYQSNILVADKWVTASGRLDENQLNAKTYATGEEVIILLTGSLDKRKRFNEKSTKQGPGPVRNLRSMTHPYVKISRRLRTIASSIPAEVINRPNVAMTWDPPSEGDVKGYYYSFNNKSAHQIEPLNTLNKPPVRTRKITSKDLEGDDVSYYFHVASVDKQGRIGQTTSIAFRIDTTKPKNVNVGLPPDTNSRDISLVLGATGASEMYISNIIHESGGRWESLNTKKQWQLSGESGSKTVYASFRDRAKNVSQTMGQTLLNVGANEHKITISANEYGSVTPTGEIVVKHQETP